MRTYILKNKDYNICILKTNEYNYKIEQIIEKVQQIENYNMLDLETALMEANLCCELCYDFRELYF